MTLKGPFTNAIFAYKRRIIILFLQKYIPFIVFRHRFFVLRHQLRPQGDYPFQIVTFCVFPMFSLYKALILLYLHVISLKRQRIKDFVICFALCSICIYFG